MGGNPDIAARIIEHGVEISDYYWTDRGCISSPVDPSN